MSPGVARAVGALVLFLLLGLLGFLVAYQWVANSAQLVVLTFDVWLFAWKAQAISAPVLIAACLGVGFVLGLGLPLSMAARLSRKNRLLQQQLALVSPPSTAPFAGQATGSDRGRDW